MKIHEHMNNPIYLKNSSHSRRTFIKKSAIGALALSLPTMDLPVSKKEKMGIVIHAYGKRWQKQLMNENFPPFQNNIDFLVHCHSLGAGGVQIGVSGWDKDMARQVRGKAETLGMFVEGSIAMPKKESDLEKFSKEIKDGKEAGISVFRTVSLGPRRYEALKSQSEFEEFLKIAYQGMKWVKPILENENVELAIENHKDWRTEELLAALKHFDSEHLGVTLDFGNSIALMEEPMETLEALAPFTFSAHIKDMALEEAPEGFLMSEVPLGQGILDLPKMVKVCRSKRENMRFNLEMITRNPLTIPCLEQQFWSTMPGTKASELAGILSMVKAKQQKLPRVSQLDTEGLLAAEENNIIQSLAYAGKNLNL
jgi:sugar phosphate isomerase/epimerase